MMHHHALIILRALCIWDREIHKLQADIKYMCIYTCVYTCIISRAISSITQVSTMQMEIEREMGGEGGEEKENRLTRAYTILPLLIRAFQIDNTN